MSEHAHDRRECRECGAGLSSWYCDVCGGFTLKAVSNVSLSELVFASGRGATESGVLAAPPRVAAVH